MVGAYRIARKAVVIGLAVCMGLCAAPAASAEGGPEVYAGLESYAWREFDEFGVQLLEETGQRFTLGIVHHVVFDSGLTLKPRFEAFGGTVDYNGETMAGTPVLSETDYSGYKAEFDVGGRFGDEVVVEPFAGIGIRAWDRVINDGPDIFGGLVLGYTEEWSMTYWRAGLRVSSASASARRFGELGIRVPISTENKVLMSRFGLSDVTLEPGDQNTYFAEAGFSAGVLTVTSYFETLRFKASPPEPLYFYYQPTSKADIFGVRVGVQF